MSAASKYLCTPVAPGVEVVTEFIDGEYVTTVHGGRLDGQEFTSGDDGQHERACLLVRLGPSARPRRRARAQAR